MIKYSEMVKFIERHEMNKNCFMVGDNKYATF